MNVLLHPTYFPNIATFAVMAQKEVVWEVCDNYQKQTYRNRCHVCSDRGRQLLNIPIKHVGGTTGRQRHQDVKIDNSYQWQRQHIRTLQTAYRSSPFFEFYEDDLLPVFEKSFDFLLDANLYITEICCGLLGMEFSTKKTTKYQINAGDLCDARFLVNAKKELSFEQKRYSQVFGDRHGFLENTSILDLLFNEGTNALSYLKSQELSFLHA